MKRGLSPVQGAELWIPKDGALVLRSGAYGPHTEFARVSARSRFQRGEGLPGAVWEQERALVWSDLGTHFVRAEYAAAAGIDGAVGLPWFNGRELAGVLTLLLTSATDAIGCIELWNHDSPLEALKHGGGHYVNVPEFERLSRLIQFPYAAGLPGLAWSTGVPVLVDDVRASSDFIRARPAANAGLARGVSVPVYRERKVVHVLAFLCGAEHSFLRAFELFVREDQGLVSRVCFDDRAPGAGEPAPGMPRPRELLAREARYSQLPLITSAATASGPGAGGAPVDSAVVITLPIHDSVRLRAIACLEF
jgi:GAF domain-containing protein